MPAQIGVGDTIAKQQQAIAALPPLRQVIQRYHLSAQKKWGQNFLLDMNITRKIVGLANIPAGCHVIEIGPGPGGLTRALLSHPHITQVVALEKDPRCCEALQPLVEAAEGRLVLHCGDALQEDLRLLCPAPRAIVANLPYNIATALLFRALPYQEEYQGGIHVMVQKEVADRLTAICGTKHYGRLAIMTGWRWTVKKQMSLPASAFTPPPKVQSTVVGFQPRSLPPEEDLSWPLVENLVKSAFQHRRKMLKTTFQTQPEILHALREVGVDLELRPENVERSQFLQIAAHFSR